VEQIKGIIIPLFSNLIHSPRETGKIFKDSGTVPDSKKISGTNLSSNETLIKSINTIDAPLFKLQLDILPILHKK
jgi:hypothetical protein